MFFDIIFGEFIFNLLSKTELKKEQNLTVAFHNYINF
jgi:hypothetical protein